MTDSKEAQDDGKVSVVVSKEDLGILDKAMQTLRVATLEHQVAELQHRTFLQQIYLKYNLSTTDSINEQTGEVTPGGAVPPTPEETPPVENTK